MDQVILSTYSKNISVLITKIYILGIDEVNKIYSKRETSVVQDEDFNYRKRRINTFLSSFCKYIDEKHEKHKIDSTGDCDKTSNENDTSLEFPSEESQFQLEDCVDAQGIKKNRDTTDKLFSSYRDNPSDDTATDICDDDNNISDSDFSDSDEEDCYNPAQSSSDSKDSDTDEEQETVSMKRKSSKNSPLEKVSLYASIL